MSSITGSGHQHIAAHVLQGVGAWASQHRDKVNPRAGSLREASARPEDNDSTDRAKLTNYHYHHYRASHHDVGSRANGHGSLADPARPSVQKDAPETNTKPEQPRNPAQQLVPMTRSSPSTDSTIHPRSRDRQFHYNHHNQHHQHPLSMPAQSGPWHPLRGVPQLNHSPPTTSNNNSMQGRTRSGSPSSLRAEYGSDIDEQD